MEVLKKMVDDGDWEGLAHYFRNVSCRNCVINLNCRLFPIATCTELFLEYIKKEER